jgi:SAM-dependent methyltransferase
MSKHKTFWDKEYKTGEHLRLSEEVSEDLEKFCRFVDREEGKRHFNVTGLAVDMGCGNGRNLIYLSQNFGMRGIGYDISDEAIKIARLASEGMPLQYEARSIAGAFPNVKDGSANIVMDMMSSHFLSAQERLVFRDEVVRILRDGGWFYFKTFLKDEDLHAKRLLSEHGTDEENTYMHPRMGVPEHVWTQGEIEEVWGEVLTIHKIEKSHKHILHGKAFKRRTVSVYMQKL